MCLTAKEVYMNIAQVKVIIKKNTMHNPSQMSP
jgi:hypothetical protein